MNKQELLQFLEKVGFSKKIVEVFAKVPRENFVPEKYKGESYGNYPLSIGKGQTISQPYTIALMVSLLDLKEGQKVLEVGSGCGYVLALISEITKKKVYGIEVIKELAEKSRENLKDYNVEVYNRNGKEGLKEESPFKRILISAACKEIPKTLLSQLANKGILVAPVGPGKDCLMVKIQREKNKFVEKERISGFGFVEFVE